MVKKTLMGATVSHLLKELSPEIPEGQEPAVENEVVNKLKTILGENWVALPVTGPYMMVTVLVMNYVLLPRGVTPITVADKVLTKSREYELDHKFSDLLISAKTSAHSTGEFTGEKLKELSEYSEEKGKKLGGTLKELIDSSQEIGKNVLDSGKSLGRGLIKNIKNKLNSEEEKQEDNE